MKKTITIEIEDEAGVNVYYEREGEQRKHWSECDTSESVDIYAASRVLAAGTQVTAAYVASGMQEVKDELAKMTKMFGKSMEKIDRTINCRNCKHSK